MTSATIVIPTRGGAQRLPVLLGALCRQSSDDFEVVVVIDGDTDNSSAVVAGWTDQLRLRSVTFPENRGRSVALNAGFSAASGHVLIRCDDDLEPGPHHVQRHVDRHAGPARVGVIGLCPNVLPDTAYARAYGAARDTRFRTDAYAMPPDQRWRLWGANVSVTRETWDDIGGYDTAYRAYGFEDVDWGYRLHRAGVPILLDPELEAAHHGAATTTAMRAARAFHSGAARRTFERLHGSAPFAGPTEKAGLWGQLVHGVGGRIGHRGVARLAKAADRSARVLPRYLAEKTIAFTVETAAVAGQHAPPDAVSTAI